MPSNAAFAPLIVVMIGGFFSLVALFFVHRSFYGMRIPADK